MSKTQTIGIDVGTTGVKTILIDDSGTILADVTHSHDLHSPHAGWAEEDPQDWIDGTLAGLAAIANAPEFLPDQLAAIGVSGMVPALVMLDGDGRPLRPSIQQNDARASREVEELADSIDQKRLYERTGGYTNQQHIAPRLLWVQRHEPDVWNRTKTLLGSYDLVTAHLTGQPPSSCSLELNWAIESGLFNFREMAWIPEVLAAVDLDESYLPPVHHPVDIVGELDSAVASATGMPPGIPIAAGSADHIASALSAGLREDGDTVIKFGGAGDILYCTSEPVTHPKLFIDAHDIPGKYLLNGCMAASGSLLKWLVSDILGKSADKSTFVELDERAMEITPGSEGVVILPYFLGEKTPIMNPDARGVIFGLDLSHQPQHLYRAVLESVIYGFRHHVDVLRQAGHEPTRYLATNGGVTSSIWRQISADVLGVPVTSFPGHPGSSLGVAFVAGMAAGVFADWDEIDRFIEKSIVNEPDPESTGQYDASYAIYRELYHRLEDLFQPV